MLSALPAGGGGGGGWHVSLSQGGFQVEPRFPEGALEPRLVLSPVGALASQLPHGGVTQAYFANYGGATALAIGKSLYRPNNYP